MLDDLVVSRFVIAPLRVARDTWTAEVDRTIYQLDVRNHWYS